MVKQGNYVLGYGNFESGSYKHGDYCWVTRKGRTANVNFDSSPYCTNSASEPSTCHYDLNVCACTEEDDGRECWNGRPASDDEFSFYQNGHTWKVTNKMVKQGNYVLGYGNFESGSYKHGDYCWVTRKGRTANVNFDSSPSCINSASEPSTCHYELNVCACTEDDGMEESNGETETFTFSVTNALADVHPIVRFLAYVGVAFTIVWTISACNSIRKTQDFTRIEEAEI